MSYGPRTEDFSSFITAKHNMSIERLSSSQPVGSITRTGKISDEQPQTSTRSASTIAATEQTSSTQVTLSNLSASLFAESQGDSDINMERVNEIKAAIEKGTLKLDAEKIADALLKGFSR